MEKWFYAQAGKQQGPVSVDELSRLAAQGIISLENTLVWREGMSDWSQARDVPELVAALSPRAVISTAPSASAPTIDPLSPSDPFFGPHPGSTPRNSAAPLNAAPGYSFSNAYSAAAAILNQRFGLIFLSVLIVFAPTIVSSLMQAVLEQMIKNATAEVQLVIGLLTLLILCCFLMIGMFFQLGQIRLLLKICRGENAKLSTIFGEGQRLMSIAWTSTLYGLGVILGLAFFIFPGIYLALRWSLYIHVSLDEGLNGVAALKRSYELTRRHSLSLLVLWFITSGMVVFSIITVVGAIWVVPFSTCLPTVIYLLTRGETPAVKRP